MHQKGDEGILELASTLDKMEPKFKKWDEVIIGVPTSLYDVMKQPERVVLEPTAVVVLSYSDKEGYTLGPISSIRSEKPAFYYVRREEHIASPNNKDIARMLKACYKYLNECNNGE